MDGYLLHAGVQHTNLSLQLMISSLRDAIGFDAALTDADLEEFIKRFGMFKTSSADDRPEHHQFIECNGHRISQTAVESAFESLFGANDEGRSLADVIVETLSKVTQCLFIPPALLLILRQVPRDVRVGLVSRLVLCGPVAALPSFPARLIADIKRLLLTPRYRHLQGISQLLRVVDCIVPPDLLLWIGSRHCRHCRRQGANVFIIGVRLDCLRRWSAAVHPRARRVVGPEIGPRDVSAKPLTKHRLLFNTFTKEVLTICRSVSN